MKINNRKKLTTKKIVIASVILALLLGASAFAWVNYSDQFNEKKTDEDTSRQNTDSEDSASDSEPPAGTLPSKDNDPGKDSSDAVAPVHNDHDTPAKAPEAPNLERSSQSGSNVKVVATLQKESDGTCAVHFTKSDQNTLKYNAKVTVGPSYYTCSFTIPVSNFPSSGDWDTTVLHKQGTGVANSDTVVTTITK